MCLIWQTLGFYQFDVSLNLSILMEEINLIRSELPQM